MNRIKNGYTRILGAGLLGIGFLGSILAVIFGPFIYHIIWCINMASETGSAIALLIVGVILPFIGWIHGVALLFGWTWI